MITDFKYSRDVLIKLIYERPRTKDGNFLLSKEIRRKMLQRNGGNTDDIYFYERKMFENNLYFSSFDIILFLANRDMQIKTDCYHEEQTRFATLNAEMVGKSLNYKFKEKDFTVEELIDCNEFFEWRKCYFK